MDTDEKDKMEVDTEKLELSPNNFQLSQLVSYQNLRKLVVRNLSSIEALHTFVYLANSVIQWIDVGRDTCNLAQLQLVRDTALQYPHLQHLNLDGVVVANDKFLNEVIAEGCPNLVSLSMRCTRMISLKPISRLQYLNELDVAYNYLDKHSIKWINKSVTSLDLSHNEFTDKDVRELSNNKNLTFLNVEHQRTNYIKPQTLAYIDMKVNHVPVVEPVAKRMEVTDTKAPEQVNQDEEFRKRYPIGSTFYFNVIFEHFPTITKLDGFVDRTSHFEYLHKFTNLRTLIVYLRPSDNQTDDYAKLIEEIVKVPSIQMLGLGVGLGSRPFTVSKRHAKMIAEMPNLLEFNGGMYNQQNADEFNLEILKSKTLRTIYTMYMSDSIETVNAVLASKSLENVSNADVLDLRVAFEKIPMPISVVDHLKVNKRAREQLQQLLPLVAGLQLGGRYRDAIINFLPTIYNFAEVTVPERSHLLRQAELIEPTGTAHKRKLVESERPKKLPFLGFVRKPE